jgi:oligopeptide/dipeptide ABC transporter ATP-binding protein
MTVDEAADVRPTVETTLPTTPVLCVENLSTTFAVNGSEVRAVRSVSFELRAGETMVLLGESGSGKSVTARSIMRLHGPRARIEGSIMLAGVDVLAASDDQMRALRGSTVAMVPQDPTGALDPLRRIGKQLVEVMLLHRIVDTKPQARDRAVDLLRQVGIPDPHRVFRSFPHELSGGMRQRVAIAIAISCDPALIVADEPTTALDVTVQAQVLELFAELQQRLGTALLMVTHDVGVAADIADRIAVMYAGSIVESGPGRDVLDAPRHPYTRALLAAVPNPETLRGALKVIAGSPPTAGEPFAGCAFAGRCDYATAECNFGAPSLVTVASGRKAACPVLNPSADNQFLAGAR